MNQSMVIYFSASGQTKALAIRLAKELNCESIEIKPVVPYNKEDLNWMDKNSRSSIEMQHKEMRPEIKRENLDLKNVDTIYLGFPIWWYVAPTIVNSFLESYDLTNKTIVLFATSGGSDFGNTLSELKISSPNSIFKESMVLTEPINEEKITKLIEKIR